MGSTEASVIARIQQILQDPSTVLWGTAEIGGQIAACLYELSHCRPRVVLATVTTTASQKWVDVSGVSSLLHGSENEASFDAVEFRVDKDPTRWRNFEIKAGRLFMDIDFAPDTAETVRLWTRQVHALSGTATNTMSGDQERLLTELVAARLAINYTGQGYQRIKEGLTDINTAATVIGNMTNQLATAIARLESGTAFINIIPVGSNPDADCIAQARGRLSVAGEYLNQAMGYARDGAARMSMSQVVKDYQQWGELRLSMALNELKQSVKSNINVQWPRGA